MSESNYREDHKQEIDRLMLPMPGVKGSKAFGYPAYKVNGKIFAFVGGSGLILKLPEARVKALIGTQPELSAFEVSAGVIWKAWISIDLDDSSEFERFEDLMIESLAYVAGS